MPKRVREEHLVYDYERDRKKRYTTESIVRGVMGDSMKVDKNISSVVDRHFPTRRRYGRRKRGKKSNLYRGSQQLGLSKAVETYSNQTENTNTLHYVKLCASTAKGTDLGSRFGAKIWVEYISVNLTVHNTNQNEQGWMRMCVLDNLFVGRTTTTNMFQQTGDTNNPTDWAANEPWTLIRDLNTFGNRIYFDKKRRIYAPNFHIPVTGNVVFKFNIPIKRMFVFNTEAAADDRILPDMNLMYWYVRDSNGAFTADLDVDLQITTYFRNL